MEVSDNYENKKVYATTTRPYCTMISNWLTTKQVPFEKILVDQDQKAAMDMVQKNRSNG